MNFIPPAEVKQENVDSSSGKSEQQQKRQQRKPRPKKKRQQQQVLKAEESDQEDGGGDESWPMVYEDMSQDPEIKEGDLIAQKLPYPPDMERSARVRKGVLQRQRDDQRNPKYKNPGRKLPLEERQVLYRRKVK